MYKVKILIVSLWPWEYLWNTFEIAIMNSANALGQWICLQFASSDYLSNVGYYIDNPIFDQKVRIVFSRSESISVLNLTFLDRNRDS